MKDGDLIVAKIKERQKQDQLERILNLCNLKRCYALPRYQPDLIDCEGYYQVSRN